MHPVYLAQVVFAVLLLPFITFFVVRAMGYRKVVLFLAPALILLVSLLAAFSHVFPPDDVVRNQVWLGFSALSLILLAGMWLLMGSRMFRISVLTLYLMACVFFSLGTVRNAYLNEPDTFVLSCESNLRSIGGALAKYEQDHPDAPSLETLVSEGYLVHRDISRCPAGGSYHEHITVGKEGLEATVVCTDHLDKGFLTMLHEGKAERYKHYQHRSFTFGERAVSSSACLASLYGFHAALENYRRSYPGRPSVDSLVKMGYLSGGELPRCPGEGSAKEIIVFGGDELDGTAVCTNHLNRGFVNLLHDGKVERYRYYEYNTRPIQWPVSERFWIRAGKNH